jgi:hypothetical protein
VFESNDQPLNAKVAIAPRFRMGSNGIPIRHRESWAYDFGVLYKDPANGREQTGGDFMNKGLKVSLTPLDDDHVRATFHWREQDVGGGELNLGVIVRNPKINPKSESQLHADATILAQRFARAFADMLDT